MRFSNLGVFYLNPKPHPKEGFATFMEYLCIDAVYPEWQIFDEFIGSAFYNALNLDAMDSSHPIEVPVGHPSEIDEIFDAISYCKGASGNE